MGRGRLAKTAENGAGFFWRFVEREGVAFLETAESERFRFPSLKQHPLFDFIVAHEGIETNFGVGSLARKLKILGGLRLFRLVVILYRPIWLSA